MKKGNASFIESKSGKLSKEDLFCSIREYSLHMHFVKTYILSFSEAIFYLFKVMEQREHDGLDSLCWGLDEWMHWIGRGDLGDFGDRGGLETVKSCVTKVKLHFF